MVMLNYALAERMSGVRKSLIARLKNRTEQILETVCLLHNSRQTRYSFKSTARIIEI